MIFYKEVEPLSDLKAQIKCFWMLERTYDPDQNIYEHLWADAGVELIFSFGEPYYQKINSKRVNIPKNFVIGPFKKDLNLYSDGFTGFVAVRFLPWGAYPFSQKPVQYLVNKILSAEKVFGKKIAELSKRIALLERDKKITFLQHFFVAELKSSARPVSIIYPIGLKMLSEKGNIKISDLVKKFSVSPRQIERIFKTETGLSAKLLARIIRFNHAKSLIEKNPGISLSQLTYDCGYSDQAHFNKNFKEMFGLTPDDFKKSMQAFFADLAGEERHVVFLQDRL